MSRRQSDRRSRWALFGGLLCLIVLVLGFVFHVEAALQAWLAASLAIATIPVGCLGLLFATDLVLGKWQEDLQAPLELGAMLIPVSALLFIPVMVGLGHLYPWTSAPPSESAFRNAYLTEPFFIARAVLCFAIWTGLMVLRLVTLGRSQGLAAAGLIIYVLTASLTGIDWAMSLEPEFHSSIYGLLIFDHEVIAAFCVAVLAMVLTGTGPRHPSVIAGLMITGVLLWAYMHAMQYVIIWAGDLPHEIDWYLKRVEGGWVAVPWILAFLHGLIPFAVLLAPGSASRICLGVLAFMLLAMRVLESAWLVLPAMETEASLVRAVLFLTAIALMGGLLSALATRTRYRRHFVREPRHA